MVERQIMGGYSFLMENWKEGDKICLFGFSRGAYTARCLAGMLHKVNTYTIATQLRSDNHLVRSACSPNQILNKCPLRTRSIVINPQKAKFAARPSNIRFLMWYILNLWDVGMRFPPLTLFWISRDGFYRDTVSSVGALWPRHLPFTSSNHVVKTFRHALALDEHRSKFKANSWHHTAPDAEAAAHDPECGSPIKNQPETNIFTKAWQQTERIWDRAVEEVSEATVRQFQPDTIWSDEGASTRQATQDEEYPGRPKTDILEVWFSGCHAGTLFHQSGELYTQLSLTLDVGGGSVDDSVVYSLANPPLRWMIKETIARGAGIQYKELPLISFGVDPTSGRSTIRSNTINSRRDPFTGLRIQPLSDETALTISDSPVEGITSAARGPVPTEATNPDSSLIKRLGFKQKSSFKEDAGDAKHADGKSSMYSSSFDDTADKALEQQRKELPDYHDAVSPLYDQLKISPIWYLLEILPIRQNYQDHTGEWHRRWM